MPIPDGFEGSQAVVDLSANENPWGPSPRVIRAISDSANMAHRYPDSRGEALKVELANKLEVRPANIVLGNGSSEILDMMAGALLRDGGRAIIGWPSFPSYRSAIVRAGGQAVLVPLRDYAYDLEEMAKRTTSDTRLVILGNPNNPTGLALTQDALDQFLDRLPGGCIVCLDEAYCHYVEAQDYPKSPRTIAEGHPVIMMRTLSKAYGLAGLRIGYAIAQEPLAGLLDRQRQRFNTSRLAQIAAIAALGDADYLASIVALNAGERALMARELKALGLFTLPSEANFFLVKVGDGARVCRELKKAGVLVKDLNAVGLTEFIRVSVGLPEENALFIKRLHAVLAQSSA